MTDTTVATDPSGVLTPTDQPAGRKRDHKAGKSYGRTAKVGTLWGVLRGSVTQLLGMPATIILARLLTPADFGIAAAAMFFVELGKKLGNMGLNTALVRMTEVREEHRASVFAINAAFGLVAWSTLMLVAPWIGEYYREPRVGGAVRLAATVFLVNFFGAVEYALLQREMKFKEMAYIEWVSPVLFLVLSIGLAYAGWGYWSLLLADLIAGAAGTAAKMYFGRWRPSFAATRRGLAETVPFGVGIYAKRLLMYASENVDSLIVGGLFGVTWLGYYDKAFNAMSKMSQRLSVGSNVMFRIFAIIQSDRERFVRAYSKVLVAGTLTTLPVFAGLIVAGHQFIVVLFGHKWLPAVVPFQLLCAAGAIRALGGYSSAVVQADGRIWSEVWRRLAYLGMLAAFIFAFRGWGISGAAFGVLVATAVATVLMQSLVRDILGMTWWEMIRALIPGVVAALGTAALIATVATAGRRWSPGMPDWAMLTLQAGAGAAFWVAFVLFAKFRTLQDVVDEVLNDLIPPPVRGVLERVRRRAFWLPTDAEHPNR